MDSAVLERPEGAPAPVDQVKSNWKAIVRKYERPSRLKSGWQMANSMGPYIALVAVMFWTRTFSHALTWLIAVLAAGFLMRTFIIFHDCAHNSFFKSKAANNLVGRICALLVFTPFTQWRHEHAVHHASSGDLDRRGHGDIHTLTVDEYLTLSRRKRFQYRVYRNPFMLFVFGGLFHHAIAQRIPVRGARPRIRRSVHTTTAVLVAVLVVLGLLTSWMAVIEVFVAIMTVAGAAGIWMFYVQHQFEDAYWATKENWDFVDAALHGSSYLKLPKILQWFSGNIGLHHVHHLSSRIPNYRLQRCHDENELFQTVPTMTFRTAWPTMKLKLYDAKANRLITWREFRAMRPALANA